MTVRVVFFKTNGLIVPRLIRFFTFSRWNHVGIVVNGDYYESEYGRGVSKNFDGYFHTSDKILTVELEVSPESEEKLQDFLESQLGKGYDRSALIALPFRKDWQKEDKWFCSELAAQALVHAEVLKIPKQSYRLTPRDLYLILASEKII